MTEPLVLAESESEPRSYGILSDSLEEIDVNDLFMCHEMTADQRAGSSTWLPGTVIPPSSDSPTMCSRDRDALWAARVVAGPSRAPACSHPTVTDASKAGEAQAEANAREFDAREASDVKLLLRGEEMNVDQWEELVTSTHFVSTFLSRLPQSSQLFADGSSSPVPAAVSDCVVSDGKTTTSTLDEDAVVAGGFETVSARHSSPSARAKSADAALPARTRRRRTTTRARVRFFPYDRVRLFPYERRETKREQVVGGVGAGGDGSFSRAKSEEKAAMRTSCAEMECVKNADAVPDVNWNVEGASGTPSAHVENDANDEMKEPASTASENRRRLAYLQQLVTADFPMLPFLLFLLANTQRFGSVISWTDVPWEFHINDRAAFCRLMSSLSQARKCWERMKHDGLPLIKRVSGSKYRFFNGQEPRDFRHFHDNLPLVDCELQDDGQRVVEERFELPNEMQHEKSSIPCFATGLQLNEHAFPRSPSLHGHAISTRSSEKMKKSEEPLDELLCDELPMSDDLSSPRTATNEECGDDHDAAASASVHEEEHSQRSTSSPDLNAAHGRGSGYECIPCGVEFEQYTEVVSHWQRQHLTALEIPLCRIDRCPEHRQKIEDMLLMKPPREVRQASASDERVVLQVTGKYKASFVFSKPTGSDERVSFDWGGEETLY